MITLRKRMSGPRSTRMLVPAFLFFAFASLSAVGVGAVAAICLVPAGLAIDAARGSERSPESASDRGTI